MPASSQQLEITCARSAYVLSVWEVTLDLDFPEPAVVLGYILVYLIACPPANHLCLPRDVCVCPTSNTIAYNCQDMCIRKVVPNIAEPKGSGGD